MAFKPFLLVGVAAVVFSASSAVLVSSGAVSAAPPAPVPAHRHFIEVNDELVYVGPNFCELDATAQGFAGFHAKVHVTDPGLIDVKSEPCGEE